MSTRGKLLGLISILVILLSASAYAQSVISLGDVGGAPGSTIQVPVKATGDGIAGVNLAVKFDPTVLSFPGDQVTGDPATDDSEPKVTTGDLSEGFKSYYALQDNNEEVRLIVSPESAPVSTFNTGEGTVAYIEFVIAADATQCSNTTVTFETAVPEQFGVSDDQGNSITGNYTTQEVNVQVTRPGDFNGDGSVNLSDFTILVVGWQTDYVLADFTQLVVNWMQSCE